MQRTFIAFKIEPAKEMMDCISHLRDALRMEKIKWVDPGRLHITLRFLGDTNPQQVSSIINLLRGMVPGSPTPEMVFRGLGIFRTIRDPKVLWIGMDSAPVLQNIKSTIDLRLSGLGFPAEERKFRPHLTLARIKSIRDTDVLRDLITEYRDFMYQKNLIEELVYYESILRSGGPVYLPLEKFAF
jgi:RNA 2',3'-cyclic 3'-phosphodiesterase